MYFVEIAGLFLKTNSDVNENQITVGVYFSSLPVSLRSKSWTPVSGVENYRGEKKVGHPKLTGGD